MNLRGISEDISISACPLLYILLVWRIFSISATKCDPDLATLKPRRANLIPIYNSGCTVDEIMNSVLLNPALLAAL